MKWYRIVVIAFGFAGLAMIGSVGPVAAQSNEGCGEALTRAEVRYRNGAFDDALRLASGCLNRLGASSEQTVRAYRMLALAHIKRDELRAARAAIVSLFGTDPFYSPDAIEELPVYTAMVSLVRRELRLGPSPVPVEKVQPLPIASAWEDADVGASMLPSESNDEPERRGSFFQRPGTWMTIGGVLVGSGVRSGDHVRGIGIGGLGVGAGRFTGIGMGGVGVGGGEALQGIMVGGVVVGSGGRLAGVSVGGLGVGAGGHLSGLSLGGLFVGSGKSIRGVAIGGLGVGTGGDVAGGAFALLGVGGRRNVTGLTVAGLGIGAGNHLRGLHVAGVGMTASRLSGIVVSPLVISKRAAGGIVAPLYVHIGNGGRLSGVSFSVVNHVRGQQHGLTVGLFNVASALKGVQLGLLNYAGNNPLVLRLLPGINLHF